MKTHLALVEPLIWNDVLDRPDLGIASLVAVANKAGYPTKVITGQTHFLHHVFVKDGGQEARALFEDARSELSSTFGDKRMRRLEENLAADTLLDLYTHTIDSSSLKDFMDARRINIFHTLVMDIFALYRWHVVQRKNLDVFFVKDTVERIKATEPSVVGLSAKYSIDVFTRGIIKRLREELDAPIVLGGSRLIYLRGDEVKLVLEREKVDYVVVGPGETALVSLLESLAAGKREPTIGNVSYLKDGELVEGATEIVGDLDSLPTADFSQFDLDRYLSPVRVLPLQYARGCSWRRCKFCAHYQMYGNNYRPFSKDRVQQMMAELRERHGVRHFALHDEELPPANCRRLSQSLLDNGPHDLRLYMYGRAVDRFDPETFDTMYRAGFRAVAWGLESMVQRVLDLMEKGTNVEGVERVLREAREAGISNQCFLLIGFPGETVEEARETIEALVRNREAIDCMLTSSFVLDPSSPAAHDPERLGLTLLEPRVGSDPADSDYAWSPGYRTAEGMQQEEAEKFVRDFNLKVTFGIWDVTSDRYKFIPAGAHAARMLIFLYESEGLVVGDELHRLVTERPDLARPYVLGDVVERDGGWELEPIRTNERQAVNELIKLESVPLEPFERRVIELCDTERTVAAIAQTLAAESSMEEAAALEQTRSFLCGLLTSQHCLLGFGGDRAVREPAEPRPGTAVNY